MTRLRDDGYLETDDPAVASRFLGKWGVVGRDAKGRRCTGTMIMVGLEEVTLHSRTVSYPILIPPTVVAETLEFAYLNDGTDGTGKRWIIAAESLIYGTLHVWLPLVDIDGWLCAHTTVKEAK